jgi:hypothetical protein
MGCATGQGALESEICAAVGQPLEPCEQDTAGLDRRVLRTKPGKSLCNNISVDEGVDPDGVTE